MSSFFDDLGSTIYNLVFVVFAASMANSKLAVGVLYVSLTSYQIVLQSTEEA